MRCPECDSEMREEGEGRFLCGECEERWRMEKEPEWLPAEPNSHLVGAVLATFFCFAPLGLGALVFAAIAEMQKSRGEMEAARKASKKAFLWIKAAVYFGLFFWALGLIALSAFEGRR